jgi:hypothetical protein
MATPLKKMTDMVEKFQAEGERLTAMTMLIKVMTDMVEKFQVEGE